MPATGSRFAKPVKKCFKSTEQWVYCGIDFSSLEDYISALTTKDPEKLKVYIDGYDGHSLRAWYYFPEIAKAGLKLADKNEICYTAKVGNKFIDFTENQLIFYKNKTLTGKQLWELLQNSLK